MFFCLNGFFCKYLSPQKWHFVGPGVVQYLYTLLFTAELLLRIRAVDGLYGFLWTDDWHWNCLVPRARLNGQNINMANCWVYCSYGFYHPSSNRHLILPSWPIVPHGQPRPASHPAPGRGHFYCRQLRLGSHRRHYSHAGGTASKLKVGGWWREPEVISIKHNFWEPCWTRSCWGNHSGHLNLAVWRWKIRGWYFYGILRSNPVGHGPIGGPCHSMKAIELMGSRVETLTFQQNFVHRPSSGLIPIWDISGIWLGFQSSLFDSTCAAISSTFSSVSRVQDGNWPNHRTGWCITSSNLQLQMLQTLQRNTVSDNWSSQFGAFPKTW